MNNADPLFDLMGVMSHPVLMEGRHDIIQKGVIHTLITECTHDEISYNSFRETHELSWVRFMDP